MPRHPDTVIRPNRLLVQARQRLTSPQRPGQPLSRAELADAINAALDHLYPGRNLTAHYVDHRWVGKLERGEHRWPSSERRNALRQVLGATTDTELGLYSPRRTPDAIRSGQLQDQPATRRLLHVRVSGKLLDGDPEAWLHKLDEFTNQPMRTWPQLRGRVQEYLEVLDHLQGGHVRPHLARSSRVVPRVRRAGRARACRVGGGCCTSRCIRRWRSPGRRVRARGPCCGRVRPGTGS